MYEKGFLDLLEDHLQYLRSLSSTKTITLDPSMVLVYAGDFYGYLNEVGIAKQYHWIIMRLNGYFSPAEFDGQKTLFLVPEQKEIDRLIMPYVSSGIIRT